MMQLPHVHLLRVHRTTIKWLSIFSKSVLSGWQSTTTTVTTTTTTTAAAAATATAAATTTISSSNFVEVQDPARKPNGF
jgi:hypothetical protein